MSQPALKCQDSIQSLSARLLSSSHSFLFPGILTICTCCHQQELSFTPLSHSHRCLILSLVCPPLPLSRRPARWTQRLIIKLRFLCGFFTLPYVPELLSSEVSSLKVLLIPSLCLLFFNCDIEVMNITEAYFCYGIKIFF